MNASNKPLKRFFYSDSSAEPYCVGHLRIDFGKEGDEYWSKFFEHTQTTALLTDDIRREINHHVHNLYNCGMLCHLQGMRSFCHARPEAIIGTAFDGYTNEYGFVTQDEHLTFYTLCRPLQGDYQAYIRIYIKHFEEQLNEYGASIP